MAAEEISVKNYYDLRHRVFRRDRTNLDPIRGTRIVDLTARRRCRFLITASGAMMMTSIAVSPSMAKMTATASVELD